MQPIRISLAAVAVSAALAAPAFAANPVVYRGSTAGPLAQNIVETRFGVSEIRGVSATADRTVDIVEAAPETRLQVTAGARLWIYDRDRKRVTVCRLYSGAWTGPSTVRCDSEDIRL